MPYKKVREQYPSNYVKTYRNEQGERLMIFYDHIGREIAYVKKGILSTTFYDDENGLEHHLDIDMNGYDSYTEKQCPQPLTK